MSQPQLSPQSGRTQVPLQQLPEPDAGALAHSQRLVDHIRHVIDTCDGEIDFARYMDLALYAPGLGYYSAGAAKLGESGDFITAPELSPLFGRSLGRQCYDILEQSGSAGDILELGAGSGKLAVNLLAELEQLDRLPQRYLILELSADLRERQQQLLQDRMPHLMDRVTWLDQLPPSPINGIVIANEVLDALPVHCVRLDDDGMDELVVVNEGDGFNWQRRSLSGQLERAFRQVLDDLNEPLPTPYRTEINLGLHDWLRAISSTLNQGVMLFIDYGYPRSEYYHPQRDTGTLICHYRHRAHDNPFLYPGLQDISASVDFTQLAEAAQQCDLDVSGFTTQAHFLFGCGLEDLLNETAAEDEQRYLALAREVKLLTLPSEMGERFKVMALTRGYDGRLRGMQHADFRHRL